MARDYKNAGNGKKSDRSGSALAGFVSGLSIGLLIAFAMLLYGFNPFSAGGNAKTPPQPAAAQKKNEAETPKADPAVPPPTFDFYHILPNREVNISESVAENGEGGETTAPGEGVLILQVGSFKTFEAADQIKAKLALVGIQADIQRVVINGQDTRHRVRLGPYSDPKEFEATRRRLLENDLDFMVLKLEVEEAKKAGD